MWPILYSHNLTNSDQIWRRKLPVKGRGSFLRVRPPLVCPRYYRFGGMRFTRVFFQLGLYWPTHVNSSTANSCILYLRLLVTSSWLTASSSAAAAALANYACPVRLGAESRPRLSRWLVIDVVTDVRRLLRWMPSSLIPSRIVRRAAARPQLSPVCTPASEIARALSRDSDTCGHIRTT